MTDYIIRLQYCTGVILSSWYILSMANCKPRAHSIIKLSVRPFSEGELYYAKDYVVEGKVNEPDAIMVIKLDREIEFSPYALPLLLPTREDWSDDHELYVFGYGSQFPYPPQGVPANMINRMYQSLMPKAMSKITLDKLDDSKCQSNWGQKCNTFKCVCLGSTEDYHGLAREENGAPLVSENTRVVYALAVTFMENELSPDQIVTSHRIHWFVPLFPLRGKILAMMRKLSGN